MTQYVDVKFRVEDTRTYTYAWDGEPLNEGDAVRVEDRSGEGWKKVFVVSTTDEAPPFQCKPILGRYVGDESTVEINGIPMSRDAPDCNLEAAATATRDDPLGVPLAF